MTSLALKHQCFQQGFSREIARATEKRAATAGRVLIDPARRKALTTFGQRLFHDSFNSDDIWTGLKSSLLPGYGQLDNAHGIQAKLVDALRLGKPKETAALQDALEQQFAEIGAVAQPRERMIQFGVPAVGAGAAAAYGGYHLGHSQGESDANQGLARGLIDMPLFDRLKLLIAPKKTIYGS